VDADRFRRLKGTTAGVLVEVSELKPLNSTNIQFVSFLKHVFLGSKKKVKSSLKQKGLKYSTDIYVLMFPYSETFSPTFPIMHLLQLLLYVFRLN